MIQTILIITSLLSVACAQPEKCTKTRTVEICQPYEEDKTILKCESLQIQEECQKQEPPQYETAPEDDYETESESA